MSSRKTIGALLSLAVLASYVVKEYSTSHAYTTPTGNVYTASALSPNTSLSSFAEPESGMSPVLSLIQHATSSVDLVMYQLEDTKIEQALSDDEARGVHVRILLNGGYYGKKENTDNDLAYTYLTEHGIAVHWTPNYFALTHQKTLIVDGNTALIMTFNLTPQYYASGREFGIVDTDSHDVSAIETAFESDWNGTKETAPSGTDLLWSPESKSALLALITNATTSLDIYNEEMADSDIIKALNDAATRGVKVRVTMTYSTSWKQAFTTLTKSGVMVRTYAPSATLYIHAKVVIADSSRLFVGSENFSSNSMTKNRELGIITNNTSVVQGIEIVFSKDWQNARPFVAN